MQQHMDSVMDHVLVGDCVEGMRKMPAGSVDLIVADPPYNLNKDFGAWKETERKVEWLGWTREWLTEAERVLRPGGAIFVYGIHLALRPCTRQRAPLVCARRTSGLSRHLDAGERVCAEQAPLRCLQQER